MRLVQRTMAAMARERHYGTRGKLAEPVVRNAYGGLAGE